MGAPLLDGARPADQAAPLRVRPFTLRMQQEEGNSGRTSGKGWAGGGVRGGGGVGRDNGGSHDGGVVLLVSVRCGKVAVRLLEAGLIYASGRESRAYHL